MKNNKGFSLVELIIVVAIMAVLIGVLAPQYLKYVEKSRVSSDETAISAVREAMVTSLADEKVYAEVSDGTTVTVSLGATASITSSNSALESAVKKIVGDTFKLGSKTYNSGSIIFTANYSSTDMTWKVTPWEQVKLSN